jgi:hypothetical protein
VQQQYLRDVVVRVNEIQELGVRGVIERGEGAREADVSGGAVAGAEREDHFQQQGVEAAVDGFGEEGF